MRNYFTSVYIVVIEIIRVIGAIIQGVYSVGYGFDMTSITSVDQKSPRVVYAHIYMSFIRYQSNLMVSYCIMVLLCPVGLYIYNRIHFY